MGRPQQPELNRSGRTDLDPDHIETVVGAQGKRAPRDEDAPGKVPDANQPGHHPDREQDKPPPGAVAARLGVAPDRGFSRMLVTVATAPFRVTRRMATSLRRRLEQQRLQREP